VAPDSTEKGVVDMISHITKKSTQCPQQIYVLGGHSQGGNVTYHAVPRIPAAVLAKVIAVTMFGSPVCQPQVADRCNSYCYKGDFACDGPTGGAFGNGGTKDVAAGRRGGAKGSGGASIMVKREPLQDGCAANVEVRGYVPKASGQAHLAYNRDGYCKFAKHLFELFPK
jgi:hypothetical protein